MLNLPFLCTFAYNLVLIYSPVYSIKPNNYIVLAIIIKTCIHSLAFLMSRPSEKEKEIETYLKDIEHLVKCCYFGEISTKKIKPSWEINGKISA